MKQLSFLTVGTFVTIGLLGRMTLGFYWDDFEIVSIENLNSSGTIVFDLTVKRLSKQQFGVSGTVMVAADYQKTTTDIAISYSAQANNQYVLLPLKFGTKPTCEQVNELYVKYVMKDLAESSDLPQVEEPGQEACDLLMGVRHYTSWTSRIINIIFLFLHFKCYMPENVHGSKVSLRLVSSTKNYQTRHVQSSGARLAG